MPRAKRATVAGPGARAARAKYSLYLPLSLADRIDRAQAELKVLAGAQRGQVMVTALVEIALELALADFEANKETSALCVKMLERVKPKSA